MAGLHLIPVIGGDCVFGNVNDMDNVFKFLDVHGPECELTVPFRDLGQKQDSRSFYKSTNSRAT